MSRPAPVFVIEHRIEIAGSAAAVWEVLSDVVRYPEWNPYVLALDGRLVAGNPLRITIVQANWPEPIVVEPTVVRAEASRILHWRGQVGEGGILDTDHVFEILPVDAARVEFHQYEEFRGSIAANMDAASRSFTLAAFEAMNRALDARVRGLG